MPPLSFFTYFCPCGWLCFLQARKGKREETITKRILTWLATWLTASCEEKDSGVCWLVSSVVTTAVYPGVDGYYPTRQINRLAWLFTKNIRCKNTFCSLRETFSVVPICFPIRLVGLGRAGCNLVMTSWLYSIWWGMRKHLPWLHGATVGRTTHKTRILQGGNSEM